MKTSEQRFVRNSIFFITIEITSKLSGLVLFAFAARYLGATEIGFYAFAAAVANFFVIAPTFGFERFAQKEVGRDPTLFYPYFREISTLKAVFSLIAFILFWLFLLATGEARHATALLVAGFVFFYAFLEFLNTLFRAVQRPELEMLVRVLFSGVNLLVGISVLRAGWGLTWLVLVQIASVSIAIVLAVLTIQRIATKVSYSLDWQVLRKHIVDATPFAGVLVALYLNHQISIVLLSAFAAKEEVGYFAAALRLYDNFSLIPTAIMGAFLPTMSRLYGTSVSVFVRVLRFTLKYLFILSAPIVVGTALVAPSIVLFLYGESFAPSSPALQVLNSALLFDFWNFAIDTLLIARNRDWLLFKVTWVSAVIFVSANLVLIPLFSYRGACWAILMTQALRFLILSPFLRRYLSVRVLLQLILLPTLCAAIMGSIVFTIRNWNLWVIILVGIVSYGGALLISGAVHRRDIEGLQMKIPGHPASSFLEA